MLGPDGARGVTAIDLYAGTGAVGIDLLMRGAEHVDFVEIDRSRAAKISTEIARRGLDARGSVYRTDAIAILPRLAGNRYDIVFADPPYELDPWEEVFAGLRQHDLLEPGAWIIAEHASRNELPGNIYGADAINRKRYGDTGITIYSFNDSE